LFSGQRTENIMKFPCISCDTQSAFVFASGGYVCRNCFTHRRHPWWGSQETAVQHIISCNSCTYLEIKALMTSSASIKTVSSFLRNMCRQNVSPLKHLFIPLKSFYLLPQYIFEIYLIYFTTYSKFPFCRIDPLTLELDI